VALTHNVGSPGQLYERSVRRTERRLTATTLRIMAQLAAVSAVCDSSSIIVSYRMQGPCYAAVIIPDPCY